MFDSTHVRHFLVHTTHALLVSKCRNTRPLHMHMAVGEMVPRPVPVLRVRCHSGASSELVQQMKDEMELHMSALQAKQEGESLLKQQITELSSKVEGLQDDLYKQQAFGESLQAERDELREGMDALTQVRGNLSHQFGRNSRRCTRIAEPPMLCHIVIETPCPFPAHICEVPKAQCIRKAPRLPRHLHYLLGLQKEEVQGGFFLCIHPSRIELKNLALGLFTWVCTS